MSEFPRLVSAEQHFPRPRIHSVEEEISGLFHSQRSKLPELHGKRVAVAVGSRGISNLAEIVAATVEGLKTRGAEPFVVPAMGSHGGANPEGQSKILAHYGINPERIGVPILSSMDTVLVGTTADGVPVPIDRFALESDGIVLINRVKPHTDFKGEVESGLMKMIAVGLGNRQGASSFHSWTLRLSYQHLIQSKARVALETGKILFGMAIVENAYHETALIELIPFSKIVQRERELLVEAKGLMPSLPADDIDVLVVDRIGKDISGAGMDPNVTGRWFRINSVWQDKPQVTRIVVLDLTDASEGNAVGIGLADFCGQRVLDKMDRHITYLNAVTSRNIRPAHIPLCFDTDREALLQALASLESGTGPDNVRLIRIKDTLDLRCVQVSEALLPELKKLPRVKITSGLKEMDFDEGGRLRPWEMRAE